MMRRHMPLAIAVLVFGAAIAIGATSTQAQVAPSPIAVSDCGAARYDLTGDGASSKADILYWLDQVESRGCALGGSAEGDCAALDVNGDGVISFDDPILIYSHFVSCVVTTSAVPDVARTR